MSVTAPGDSVPAFRYEAPNIASGVVSRSHLTDLVAGRFDRRLTVLVAGPGFGKTTLLAQSVLANRSDGTGIDAWLRVDPADRDPQHLLSGLVRSLTGSSRHQVVDLDDLVAAVWGRAPLPVALVLDDAHQIGDAAPAWQVVVDLLDQLPTNGHLVIAGRTMPKVPVRRMQADDAALVIDQDAMAFSEADLEAFARSSDVPQDLAARLPTWPALAVLTAAVGHQASSEFLWDEVVAGLDPERRDLLARAVLFDVVDDGLIGVLAPDHSWTTARLVEGLPLVDGDRLGSVRLHALWADALGGELDGPTRDAALVAGAESFLLRRQFRRAVEAFADADHIEGIKRSVRASRPSPSPTSTSPTWSRSSAASRPSSRPGRSAGSWTRPRSGRTARPKRVRGSRRPRRSPGSPGTSRSSRSPAGATCSSPTSMIPT